MQIHELGELFEDVQMQNLLGDGKTFPDCIPKKSLEEIARQYDRVKGTAGFELKDFVHENFTLPGVFAGDYRSDPDKTPAAHIESLWDVLTREPGSGGGSLIPLPNAYIVPGGRFREIYYWDSYFSMLGLRLSGKIAMIENMVSNFSYLIDQLGYIPNGNRTYFVGRSQPPFFSLMVRLLAAEKGSDVLKKYLTQLEKEYAFWMNGSEAVSSSQAATLRVVRMEDGSVLNRYWDENNSPRPESFKEDVELSRESSQRPEDLFRHLRAAAESGWDFSSRWFRNPRSFATIHTTDIVPVDLNCLMVHLEETLAEANAISGNRQKSEVHASAAEKRKATIRKYCWNDKQKFYFDFDFVEGKQTNALTLAAVFPLFFNVATTDEAASVAKMLRLKFLKNGGLITTTESTGQQWDAPNGWAPLQWIAYKGLLNYGIDDLALELRTAWINANTRVYAASGKMTEKYNVVDSSGLGGGGEYPNQDGFGWTNGVFLAMLKPPTTPVPMKSGSGKA